VCEDDIELHSYEEISTSPAVGYNDVNEDVKLVVDEMRLFREKVLPPYTAYTSGTAISSNKLEMSCMTCVMNN
jgi:hypothetical protein